MDYSLLDNNNFRAQYVQENADRLKEMLSLSPMATQYMELADWNRYFIYPFDVEAREKKWVSTQFQNTLGTIWDIYQKSMTWAPREHLKTHTVSTYLLKRIYERKYPLEINYYHIGDETAGEKFRKMQRIVERNPLLYRNFDLDNVKFWSEDKMELSDGTIMSPMSYYSGAVGKHPHIIVLDDVIDYRVIYSDTLNDKAITIFYTNIYPQISKEDPDRKIIMIGTSQRKNDLYNSLPADFGLHRYSAITKENKPLSPEIFSFEHLMKIKSDISSRQGERYWQKEYMNVPFEAAGLIVKEAWIQYFTSISKDEFPFMQVYQGWDLSVGKDIEKGDWTVCVTIAIDRRGANKPDGKIKIYVLDVFRARLDFGKRLQAIQNLYGNSKPLAVGVESVAFQYDTIQQTRARSLLPIVEIKAITNKVQSFQVEVGPYFENLQVYVKAGQPWTEGFVNEMLSLPVGEFDDQADAFKIAVKTALIKGFGDFPSQSLGEDEHGEEQYEEPIFAGLLEQ